MKGFGIFSWFSYPLPLKERLALIKDAGFEATSLWWGDEFGDKNRQPETARRLGLDIDYVHAPFDNPNDLWLNGINGDTYLNQLFSCIDDCSRHGIPTAVIHVTRLSSRPPVTPIGMDRIQKLVERAETRQVNLALENLDSICHLDHIYMNSCNLTAWAFVMTAGTKTITIPGPIACPGTGTNYSRSILMTTGEMRIPICFPTMGISTGKHWETS